MEWQFEDDQFTFLDSFTQKANNKSTGQGQEDQIFLIDDAPGIQQLKTVNQLLFFEDSYNSVENLSFEQNVVLKGNELKQQDKNCIEEQDTNCYRKTEEILSHANITQEIEKNTNMPKFLLRSLQNYFEIDAHEVIPTSSKLLKVKRKIKRLKYRNKHPNMHQLQKILNKAPCPGANPSLMRQIMMRILRKRAKQEIIYNNHIKNKKTYLIASKVYELRCQSELLIKRLQSK